MRLRLTRLPDSAVQAALKSHDFVAPPSPPPDPLPTECAARPPPRRPAQPRLCLHRLAESLVRASLRAPHGPDPEEEEEEEEKEEEEEEEEEEDEGEEQTEEEEEGETEEEEEGEEMEEEEEEEEKEMEGEEAEEEAEEDGADGMDKWRGEEERPAREALQQHAPRTDPHSLLHPQNAGECAPASAPGGMTNGFPHKGLLQSTHRIRVDFKVRLEVYVSLRRPRCTGTTDFSAWFLFQEDCALKNVWLLGGLSVLTSVPTTPQPVCLLCASKGHHEVCHPPQTLAVGEPTWGHPAIDSSGHKKCIKPFYFIEVVHQPCFYSNALSLLTFQCVNCHSVHLPQMIYCQICCEPFHSFCLLPEERPQEENKENWCCRRCKFCHVCGRKSKSAKVRFSSAHVWHPG